jgi:hypothetical protein
MKRRWLPRRRISRSSDRRLIAGTTNNRFANDFIFDIFDEDDKTDKAADAATASSTTSSTTTVNLHAKLIVSPSNSVLDLHGRRVKRVEPSELPPRMTPSSLHVFVAL